MKLIFITFLYFILISLIQSIESPQFDQKSLVGMIKNLEDMKSSMMNYRFQQTDPDSLSNQDISSQNQSLESSIGQITDQLSNLTQSKSVKDMLNQNRFREMQPEMPDIAENYISDQPSEVELDGFKSYEQSLQTNEFGDMPLNDDQFQFQQQDMNQDDAQQFPEFDDSSVLNDHDIEDIQNRGETDGQSQIEYASDNEQAPKPPPKEEEIEIAENQSNNVDWDQVDFVKSEFTHLLPTDEFKSAIKAWNSMSYEDQQQALLTTKIPHFVPVPVLTYYQIPVMHHYPLNQIVRKIQPLPFNFPMVKNVNKVIDVPVPVERKVVIPHMVPYGLKVPVPVPMPYPAEADMPKGPYMAKVGKIEEEHEVIEKKDCKDKPDTQRITIVGDLDDQIATSVVDAPKSDPPKSKSLRFRQINTLNDQQQNNNGNIQQKEFNFQGSENNLLNEFLNMEDSSEF